MRFIRMFYGLVLLSLSMVTVAKVNVSPLFVTLSDAMEQVKQNTPQQAIPHLQSLQQQFLALPNPHSESGKAVQQALQQALNTPSLAQFEQLSKALYSYEKEQNPVDYALQRQQFAKRVTPLYQQLAAAVKAQDLAQIQAYYKRFNNGWTLNEKVVRETSLGHYGQIETAMTLLRIAMLSEPADFAAMESQVIALGAALDDFKSGNILQPVVASGAPQTLPQGIALLEKSYQAFSENDLAQGRADITLFIQQWAVFEGDVRTRDGALYNRIESELPVIMVKGNDAANMQHFQQLLDDMRKIDVSGSYGIVDAMLILLREGVEALLIIMALLTALNAANQPRAKRWVYAGAGLGVGASLLGAVALQQLFPAVSAGTNREILEGAVGVMAVVMMLIIGAWLHSKSSLIGWQKFIQKQVTQALATGSLISMLSLSFLSVFREGAETLLFYAGMLPLIALNDLLAGIGLALLLLAFIAMVMKKSSAYLPMHHLFKVMTVLIYALGFKILGVSIHALQLTQMLPTTVISLPNCTAIGFYATQEGLIAQLLYLAAIPLVGKWFKN